MARTYRSRRARLVALCDQLRAEGQSWAQIAAFIGQEEHVNARVAMRMAHGLTQVQVAALWNERWPTDAGNSGLTDKNISYWETWPESGHEPSLRTLKRLAQLYQCDVADLIEEGSYGYLDPARQAGSTVGRSLVQYGKGDNTQADAGFLPAAVVPRSVGLPDDLTPLAFLTGHQPTETSSSLLVPLQRLSQLAREQSALPLQREAIYEQLVQFLAAWADTMKRRDLLRTLAWAATAAVAAPMFAGLNIDEQERMVRMLGSRHRIDASAIGHIESVLWSAMRQDDALGPQAALDTVLAQRNLVRAVLPGCPPNLRPRLLSLFSNLSRFAGWLSFDLSDFDSAAYFYEQARTAAHEAENTELGVFVLCNMSHLATWRGQPRVGIDHAVAAQGWAKETGDLLLRAYVADVAARAYATAGKKQECLAALDSIVGSLDHAAGRTPETSLVYFYGPAQYASTKAQSLLLLHDAPGATRSAQESLRLVDPGFVRNHAFGMLHLGNAHIQSGEIEEAARVLGSAADLAQLNHSARLVKLLLKTHKRLDPWQQTATVQVLDERLAAYGWGRSRVT